MKNVFGHRFKSLVLGALLGTLLGTTNVYAAPIAIDMINFSGSESVIDFNTIADEELITNQFAASMCVTFSGAIYGMTNSGDVDSFPNSGGVIASNWLYNGGDLQGLSFTADLGGTFTRIGFNVSTNDGDDTTIEVLVNGVSGGAVIFDTDTDGSQFIAIEDTDGFDSITVSVQNNDNGFIAIDDLRFEGGSGSACTAGVAAKPVPSVSLSGLLALMAAMLGLGLFRLRRTLR